MHQTLSILAIVLALTLPLANAKLLRRSQAPIAGFERCLYGLFLIAVGLMAFSSLLMLAFGAAMRHWMLILHMSVAPLFAICIASLALLWADRVRGRWIWLALLAGFVTIVTALLGMMTWFGSDYQRLLLDIHRISSMVLLIAVMAPAVRLLWGKEDHVAATGH